MRPFVVSSRSFFFFSNSIYLRLSMLKGTLEEGNSIPHESLLLDVQLAFIAHPAPCLAQSTAQQHAGVFTHHPLRRPGPGV